MVGLTNRSSKMTKVVPVTSDSESGTSGLEMAYMAGENEGKSLDEQDAAGQNSAEEDQMFSNSTFFQKLSAFMILASVALHCMEWSYVPSDADDMAMIYDGARSVIGLYFVFELFTRLKTWNHEEHENLYSSDSGLIVDMMVMIAVVFGGIGIPLLNGSYMKSKANDNDVVAFCRMFVVFRMPRLPMILQKQAKALYRISISSAATVEVMGWPLVFIVFLAALFGLAMVTVMDLIPDEVKPEDYPAPIGGEGGYLDFLQTTGTATWLMFRLCLMDKTWAWDVMESVEPTVMVPFLMSYIVIVRTAVGIMLFMVVLERVAKQMVPVDHKEAEDQHIEAFLEVQSLFTDPPDENGFYRLSYTAFIHNLPMCPRLMEDFAKLNLTPKDLPFIYKVLADGEKVTFRHLATDYAKLVGITKEAASLAASARCVTNSERIWLFAALLDPQRLNRIADTGSEDTSEELPEQTYKKKTFNDLAGIARGDAPAEPSKLQVLVLDLSYNICWACIVLANLAILYYQYTLPIPERDNKVWYLIDIIFLGMYTGEAILRIKAWGFRNILPWNRPWLFIDCMVVLITGTFYFILPQTDGSFMKTDTYHKYGRMFEVIKCLRLMRSSLALRKFDFWNSFVRLNFMFLSNVIVVAQWFLYFLCWAMISGFLWHYFVGTGRFLKVDPITDAGVASNQIKLRNIYFATLNVLRNTYDGVGVYVSIINYAPWTGLLYVLTFVSCSLIVANMLGGLLFVNIEKNRKGPDLEVNTWKLRHEYAAIAKNFGVKGKKRDITREDWLRGATRSFYFVPALLQIHMLPEDIPALYDHLDIDGSGNISIVEFLAMYRHIKNIQSDPLTTALIEMARSTEERAMYLLSSFENPPKRGDLEKIMS